MIESLFFAIATVVVVLISAGCVCWGLWLHHQRESFRLKTRETEVHQMYLLSDKALEMKMLPPSFQKTNRDY